MSGTIRSRTEERKAAHARMGHRDKCNYCERIWPCPDRVAADDTLTDLNNAPYEAICDEHGKFHTVPYNRLIPDPEEDNGS